MSEHLDCFSTYLRNREVFLLNYGAHCHAFDLITETIAKTWSRIGTEKDTAGQSHAGLLLFVNILRRHCILGFQHLVSYQSLPAWFMFRPGLEALLILGKLVDNPRNAATWKGRRHDRKRYAATFSGADLVSRSLPSSDRFRAVLTRLNDEFMHPNPDFTYRDTTIMDEGKEVQVEIQFFDRDGVDHEAHVLAYLNLVDLIRQSSNQLVANLLGPPNPELPRIPVYADVYRQRAVSLAQQSPSARKVMLELGLWDGLP